jgi:hypothetical protein
MLRGPGTCLDLTIVSGPDREGWCRVRVAVDTPAGRWSATDPCLTGQEVERLAEWLEATAGGAAEGRLEFWEPELAFDRAAAGPGQLRIEMRWGLRPAWAGGEPGDSFSVAVPAEPGQLCRAAEGLRSQLARRAH